MTSHRTAQARDLRFVRAPGIRFGYANPSFDLGGTLVVPNVYPTDASGGPCRDVLP